MKKAKIRLTPERRKEVIDTYKTIIQKFPGASYEEIQKRAEAEGTVCGSVITLIAQAKRELGMKMNRQRADGRYGAALKTKPRADVALAASIRRRAAKMGFLAVLVGNRSTVDVDLALLANYARRHHGRRPPAGTPEARAASRLRRILLRAEGGEK